MDQLKQILAVAQKYHFWILCTLILGMYLGTWFMAVSRMSEETEARVSEINSAYSDGQGIKGVVNHPNELSVEMMKQLNRMEAEQVRRAWERRYREQEDVLVWPAELKPDFIAAVEKLMPIETNVEYPTEQEPLKIDFRNRYRDYIREEMPVLAEIVGAEWKVSTAASSGGMDGYSGEAGMGMDYGGSSDYEEGSGYEEGYSEYSEYGGEYGSGSGYPGRREEEDPIVVEWSKQNQSELQAACFNWAGQRPTTLQVLYAQENLWVLRTLLMIIKATNGDADAQYNAAVKEITNIHLGRMARGIKSVGQVKQGRETQMGGPGGYGSDMEMMEEEYSSEYEMMEGGGEGGYMEGGSGSEDMTAGAIDPADNRYVDDEMEPLTGDQLRSAMESPSAENAFLVVAKRMPVRLRVNMDVRKLPLLLCECANSDLPVEVRQVRINTPPAQAGGMGGYGGMSGMGGSGMYGGEGGYGMEGSGGYESESSYESDYGDYGGYGSGEGYSGMGGAMGQSVESPYDADVEIYGLVYVYNPVDPEKLGLGEDEDEAGKQPQGTATAAGGQTPPGFGERAGSGEAEDIGDRPGDSTTKATTPTAPIAKSGNKPASNATGAAGGNAAPAASPAGKPPAPGAGAAAAKKTPAEGAGNTGTPGTPDSSP